MILPGMEIYSNPYIQILTWYQMAPLVMASITAPMPAEIVVEATHGTVVASQAAGV
jgi:hypothetical protein